MSVTWVDEILYAITRIVRGLLGTNTYCGGTPPKFIYPSEKQTLPLLIQKKSSRRKRNPRMRPMTSSTLT
jgi:hypothetical protein